MDYNRERIKAELMNQFQNEDYDWYDKAVDEVINEASKDGDSIANVINQLYR
jgi:hypothetical protein